MNKFKKRYEQLKKYKEDRDNGVIHGIPLWESFPKLGNLIPTIDKGQVILNFAASGIGKSMITRWKDIIVPYLYCKAHPEQNINLKFVLFLLEDNEKKFIDFLTSAFLNLEFKIKVSPKQLRSAARKELPKEILDKIEEVAPVVEDLLSKCYIYDSVYNSYGIYKTCRELSEDWGNHYYIYNEDNTIIDKLEFSKLKELSDNLKGIDKKELLDKKINLKEYQNFWKYSHYQPNDKNEHVIMVLDNLNCLAPDKHELSLKAAMDTMAYKYIRMGIAKHWDWTCVMVQQSVGGAEEQAFDFKGNKVIAKLKPKLADLGDSKLTQRACHLIYALFKPARYEIEEYLGYDTLRLKDNARFLSVLKNNDGDSDIEVPLLFFGMSNYFRELPNPMTESDYKTIEDIQKQMR